IMSSESKGAAARGREDTQGATPPGMAGLGAAPQKLPSTVVLAGFRSPLAAFRPAPFYWWAGGPLNRDRIAWQLDRLKEKGICQVIVSYPHGPDGATDPGTPRLFSREWWELFRWFLSQCRERDMTAGFQDYTLVGPMLREIGSRTPGMRGGQMSCVWTRTSGPAAVALSAEPATLVIGAWAYPLATGVPQPAEAIDLTSFIRKGTLVWNAPESGWLAALVFVRLATFDPMNPESGHLAIERLYAPFDRECPGEVGHTLKLFFQDELDFGSSMPFWSEHLRAAFQSRQGYDLWPFLPALWLDLGPATAKVRLDYSDVVTYELERCYFQPVFQWHEQHGTLFGHDNMGRGEMRRGREHYGDYFRSMRWYSAPGCDDPKISCPRAFKGLKVSSSIAHLYHRPRVWVEAFHSSGWGTPPAEVVAGLNEEFACGATFVNLHGLYYTTRGGWWEWAPPDFHFRQPYWEHCGPLNDYFTRLSWLLSQGTHRCDVAILYPSAALEAEATATGLRVPHAHVGHAAIEDSSVVSLDPERVAFGLGKYLFDRACDFDFIDFQSLARATAADAELRVSGEAYRVLILPAMAAVRLSTLEAARDYVRVGGLVIACGCLPTASERTGAGDPQIETLLAEIFSSEPQLSGGRGFFVPQAYGEVLRLINEFIPRDAATSTGPLQVLHRHLETQEVFYVFNPARSPLAAEVRFRATGAVEQWDAWTAAVTPLPVAAVSDGVSILRLTLAAHEAKLVIFQRQAPPHIAVSHPASAAVQLVRFDGPWNFTVQPTLDNRFGDFRLPAAPEFLGPEARRFKWAEETTPGVRWYEAAFDDSLWPETTFSFGPRFEVHGPLPPGAKCAGPWWPYAFSLRWGIERDPFLADWLSGPHGLKGRVPDEFLDFHCDRPGSEWLVRAQVVVEADREVTMLMGGRCAYQAWVNEQLVLEQIDSLPPGRYAPWNIPHYDCIPRKTRVWLRQGVNHLRLKLVQPEGQRTRAFVAFDPPPRDASHLGIRWFTDPQAPRPALLAAPERRAVWLRCLAPPGLRGLQFVARGPARVWAGGNQLTVEVMEILPDGSLRYRVMEGDTHPRPVSLALRIEAAPEYRAGDVLPEPVRFECGVGQLPVGDWCAHGLGLYSGIGEYQRSFELVTCSHERRLLLDLGEVSASAEVRVNGILAGVLCAPPWRLDVTEMVHTGTNTVAIQVANTLANHYSVGIPTPYAFPHQTRSGLFGPVRLIHEQAR
ncbi:MAG: glycosyl hydrolase, partial [Verrucomicrobia bacterium]|nr:glycosyl hydrolase [Verrucomicrobiota bacterium]